MTWRQLLRVLKGLPESSLDDNATVYDFVTNEYHPVEDWNVASDGVLDNGQLFLVIRKTEDSNDRT